jgi:hypothetical protein
MIFLLNFQQELGQGKNRVGRNALGIGEVANGKETAVNLGKSIDQNNRIVSVGHCFSPSEGSGPPDRSLSL